MRIVYPASAAASPAPPSRAPAAGSLAGGGWSGEGVVAAISPVADGGGVSDSLRPLTSSRISGSPASFVMPAGLVLFRAIGMAAGYPARRRQPPATAGMMATVSPSGTGVS